MAIGYRLIIHEGGRSEDRSVIGWAGLEPENPAMNETQALELQKSFGGRIERFECKNVVSPPATGKERVTT